MGLLVFWTKESPRRAASQSACVCLLIQAKETFLPTETNSESHRQEDNARQGQMLFQLNPCLSLVHAAGCLIRELKMKFQVRDKDVDKKALAAGFDSEKLCKTWNAR